MSKNNDFYKKYYKKIIIGMMIILLVIATGISIVMYQFFYRPLPLFYAAEPGGKKMVLRPSIEPNLMPNTILRWASNAAMVAYNFDFANYEQQILVARPYFTEDGWADYLRSVQPVIQTIAANKLIVSSVVSGTPVISNQGDLFGKGFVWRVQIPFLVTYQSLNATSQKSLFVIITIVRVPTTINPQGIGVDQFVMTG